MRVEVADPTPESIPYPEYVLRILFAAFFPAVRMAVELSYPLDTVKDLMTLALWREAKKKHTTINLISLIFGKSTRTVKALSARFNKGGFFAESETNLMRRVEDLLRERPLSLEELSKCLPLCAEFDSTRLAVEALLRAGRIAEVPTAGGGRSKYQVVARHQDLSRMVAWETRLDALYEHLEAVTETIRRRFLDDAPEDAAARTFTFKARPEDMQRLRDELFDYIRARYPELEARAEALGDGRNFAIYAGVTPLKRGGEL